MTYNAVCYIPRTAVEQASLKRRWQQRLWGRERVQN